MDTEKWGRNAARERYGSKGMKKMADGGEVLDTARNKANEKSWISGQSPMDRAKIPFQLKAQGLGYPLKAQYTDNNWTTPESVSNAVPRKGE